jgi:hypothetical protein
MLPQYFSFILTYLKYYFNYLNFLNFIFILMSFTNNFFEELIFMEFKVYFILILQLLDQHSMLFNLIIIIIIIMTIMFFPIMYNSFININLLSMNIKITLFYYYPKLGITF